MELRQLELFVAIAEAGAYSRAALRVSVAQPILSRQIRALEEELGVALFHRTGRGVTLTEAGVVLEQYARGLLDTSRQAMAAVRAVAEVPGGPVVIGMPSSLSEVLSVSLVQAFREAFPHTALKVMEGYSGHVLEWLTAGRIDVAVLYDAPRLGMQALGAEPVLRDELFLLGPVSDPSRLGSGPVPVSKLAHVPLILPSRPHGIRVLVDEALASVRARPKVEMEIDAMHSMLRMVESGLGYAVLSYSCVAEQIADGRMRIWRMTEPAIERTLLIAMSSQRPSTRPVRALSTLLRWQISNVVATGRWAPSEDILS